MPTPESSSHTSVPASQSMPRRHVTGAERRRVIAASTIGTTVEFYDFYVYATAAVAVFPYLFFAQSDDQLVSLLQSFATFGLAFVARPLGSVIFGHFGDRVGRQATLVYALLTMGIATVIIGLLPTYSQIGLWAPALLALMRFCQGLGLGGEWSGAALLASENAEDGKRAQAAMWPQLGAPFGFFLANGLFLILVLTLTESGFPEQGDAFFRWGWRIPFLLSAVMVGIGLYVRIRLEETPVFEEAVNTGKRLDSPLKTAFTHAWRPMIAGTFIMVACYTIFYLVTTWVLSYGIADPSTGAGLGISYADFLKLQLISIVMFMIGVPVSGWLADTFGRRPTLTWVSVAMIVFSFTFGFFLDPSRSGQGHVLAFLIIGMTLMGLIFGPMSVVLPELFPTNVRYTGSGIAYNVSSILGAGLAPFVATWLANEYGVIWVGVYLGVMSVISLFFILQMRESRDRDLSEI